jgi:hypothetical protein
MMFTFFESSRSVRIGFTARLYVVRLHSRTFDVNAIEAGKE